MRFALYALDEGVASVIHAVAVVIGHWCANLVLSDAWQPATQATSRAKALHAFSHHIFIQMCFAFFREVFQWLSAFRIHGIGAASAN